MLFYVHLVNEFRLRTMLEQCSELQYVIFFSYSKKQIYSFVVE